MRSVRELASVARRLNRAAGGPPVPALYFFTDPARTPDPVAIAKRLPRGSAVVYRHFGAPDRARVAGQLARVCRARALVLLIAADPPLARRVRADGVHWPEARLPARRDKHARLVTAAAHSAQALARAMAHGVDVCVLGPVFPTESPSGRPPLGLFRASQLAHTAGVPVMALGGVTPKRARRLTGRGFAGLAAVGALADA